METFSVLVVLVRRIHRSAMNSPRNGQWRGALMFSLICAWINVWVNNHEAGDMRRHRTHHDVIVMYIAMLTLKNQNSARWRYSRHWWSSRDAQGVGAHATAHASSDAPADIVTIARSLRAMSRCALHSITICYMCIMGVFWYGSSDLQIIEAECDANVCPLKKLSLVQITACCLFGTKPLSETILPIIYS